MLAIAPSANPALGTAPSPCARLHAVPKIRPMELYGQCYALDESEAKGALRDGKTSMSKYASSKVLSRCAPALRGPPHYGSVRCVPGCEYSTRRAALRTVGKA